MGFFDSKKTQMGIFKFPKITEEIGEIERVAIEFAKGDEDSFERGFVDEAKKSQLSRLEESIWRNLENTDSVDVKKGDWSSVAELSKQVDRDWENLKFRFEKKQSIYAPIILKTEKVYHLVSGNTRLMVARAMGITPYVLIVDMTNFGSQEAEGE